MEDQISDIKIPMLEEQEPIIQGLENIKIFARYNLQRQYECAQVVKLVNGVEFYWQLFGKEYEKIKSKLNESMHFDNGVYLSFTSIYGEKYYSDNIPYLLLKKFINNVNSISTENYKRKIKALQDIENVKKIDELLELCSQMHLHTSKQIKMPDLKETIYISNNVINVNELTEDIHIDINNIDVNLRDNNSQNFERWYNEVKQSNGELNIFVKI